MVALEHPRLVQFYGYTKLPLQLILEFCSEGTLDLFLQRVSRGDLAWELRFRLARQLTEGLAYLHEHDIVHGSISIESVLIDGNLNAKWTNFGVLQLSKFSRVEAEGARRLELDDMIRWMPPEQAKGEVESSKEADIYSYALILWTLTTHSLPYFNLSDKFQLIKTICSYEKNPIPSDIPKGFGNAIRFCWHDSAKERPTARQLSRYLDEFSI